MLLHSDAQAFRRALSAGTQPVARRLSTAAASVPLLRGITFGRIRCCSVLRQPLAGALQAADKVLLPVTTTGAEQGSLWSQPRC